MKDSIIKFVDVFSTDKDIDEDRMEVYLDGKRVVHCLSANELEGWIEIVDQEKLRQLTSEAGDPGDEDPTPVDLPRKRLLGSVVIMKIKKFND